MTVPYAKPAAPPPLLRGLAEIADRYEVILCDVWGVIHNGLAHYPQAVEALRRFRAKGGTVVLITNAPRPRAKVKELLGRLGVPPAAYDAIVSSGDVTVSLIAERGDAPLLHLGPSFDRSLFETAAALTGRAIRLGDLATAAYVVCTGLDDADRETPDDYAARLALMRQRNLDFVCANPDNVVEVGSRLVYCAGALAEAYAALGGTVIQAGKPYAPIYAKALAEAAQLAGRRLDLSRVLAIGDALETDIKGGESQSLATLFVTAGIHRVELYGPDADGPPLSKLDLAAFHQLMDAAGCAPTAVIPQLVW